MRHPPGVDVNRNWGWPPPEDGGILGMDADVVALSGSSIEGLVVGNDEPCVVFRYSASVCICPARLSIALCNPPVDCPGLPGWEGPMGILYIMNSLDENPGLWYLDGHG